MRGIGSDARHRQRREASGATRGIESDARHRERREASAATRDIGSDARHRQRRETSGATRGIGSDARHRERRETSAATRGIGSDARQPACRWRAGASRPLTKRLTGITGGPRCGRLSIGRDNPRQRGRIAATSAHMRILARMGERSSLLSRRRPGRRLCWFHPRRRL